MKTTDSFDTLSCIRTLVSFSPRQFEGERKAGLYLRRILAERKIPYLLQSFRTTVPIVEKSELVCDGKKTKAEGCSFVSGTVDGKDVLLSSAMPSRYCHDIANLNVNPSCPVIAPGNHYFAPALAISHETLRVVLASSDVRGTVRVRKKSHDSFNILAGNAFNPETICFAHYDGIKTGAIDNASGVAVMMSVLLKNKGLMDNCLFVFAGNEELSYDRPTYWGHGFRAMEKKYPGLFRRARRIIAVDCVGNGKPRIITDTGTVSRAFPLVNKAYAEKTSLLTGDFAQLMTVYHSDLDDGRGIEKKYLEQTETMLLRQLRA